eukprot:jgi/Orpsp1_1/1175463/evm.model.c7180000054002.1
MSDNFWDYAIKYANYIFNKVPHNSINNKIPDEIYYKKKANINHVRVFGCVTYYKDYSQNKHKFAPNSKKGVFLGFSERHNSYIIMDSEDHKIHHVREIYCKEDTPSEIRLPNTFKNEFNDPDFLNFNFNFTNNRLEPNNNWNTNENSNNENENQILITDDKNEKEINKNNENLIQISENSGNDFESNSQSNLNNEDIVINTDLENPLTVDNENNSNDSKITENNENINIQKSTLQNISDSENKIPISSEKNFINKNSSNFQSKIEQTLNNNKLINKNFSINENKLNNENKILNNSFSDNNNNNSNENNINLLPNLDIKINKLFDSNNEENNTNNILQNTNDNIQNKNLDINNSNNENTNFDKGNSNVNKKSSFNNRKSVKNLVIKNDVNVSNTLPKLINKGITFRRLNLYKKSNYFNSLDPNNKNNIFNFKPLNSDLNNVNYNNKNIKVSLKIKRPHSPTFGNKFSKFRKTNFNTKTIYSINYNVPSNFYQATHCKDHKLWEKAIKDELNNLYNNNIMDFVPFVPKGKTIITTRWVFACKFDSNGNIIKFKARLVARGFNQKFGIDFELTFSPTLNIDCLKLIFSLSAKFKWPIYQLDIKAAYLNANLDKEIYTTIPPGDTNFGRGYWKLNKALYGLKQSGRQWYITISTFLIEQGFHQLSSEKCLFKRIKNGKLVCLIGLYVDDMVITGNINEIKYIVNRIKYKYNISKAGPIDFILGIKVENYNFTYKISQIHFINNILHKFNVNNMKKVTTPCVGDNKISENKEPFDKTTYKSAIGMLIYLSKCTRPDIAFAVNKAARNSENPTVSDWVKVKNILKYLNNTKEYKLHYDGKGKILGYSDSDYAGDLNDRKSTSGNIILMGENPICWNSKKQSVVATSTAEAEYISTSLCIKKILWIRNILYELFKFNEPITIYSDNTASIKSMENGDLNPKLKHISIKYHFNYDYIKKNVIKLKYIETSKMLADILTKCVNGNKILNFANR